MLKQKLFCCLSCAMQRFFESVSRSEKQCDCCFIRLSMQAALPSLLCVWLQEVSCAKATEAASTPVSRIKLRIAVTETPFVDHRYVSTWIRTCSSCARADGLYLRIIKLWTHHSLDPGQKFFVRKPDSKRLSFSFCLAARRSADSIKPETLVA